MGLVADSRAWDQRDDGPLLRRSGELDRIQQAHRLGRVSVDQLVAAGLHPDELGDGSTWLTTVEARWKGLE